MSDTPTSADGDVPSPPSSDSAGSRLLTEQDAERRWKRARALVEEFAERGELEDVLYEFAGEADALAAALVERDAELARTERTLAEVRVYAHGFKDAEAELEAQLDARDGELAEARHEIERLESEATETVARAEVCGWCRKPIGEHEWTLPDDPDGPIPICPPPVGAILQRCNAVARDSSLCDLRPGHEGRHASVEGGEWS